MVERAPHVGRDAEQAEIADALTRCRSGTGGLVLVSGDAGIGKSRLISEALSCWDGGVLHSAATATGGPYSPLVDIVRMILEQFGSHLLSGQVTVLLPELGMPWRDADRPALVAGLRHTLRGVATQEPAVVVLEDLHWASAATLDLLPSLAVALATDPVLMLGTYRSEALPRNHPIRRMRTELRRIGHLRELALQPLSPSETGQLLAGILGDSPAPALVTAVYERCEGLPFFIEEIAAWLTDADRLRTDDGSVTLADQAPLPVPDSVLDAVLVRTAAVRRQSPRAVELAAVLGVQVDLVALADLVDPTDVDRLIAAELLTERGSGTAVFRHALVRDALYRAIPWTRRRDHHREVARWLATHDALPETVADHWIAAHEPQRARPLLLAASERHCAVHAYRDAATLIRRALSTWPPGSDSTERVAVLEHLARCAELCGDLDAAVTTWAEVCERHRIGGDLSGAAEADRRLANAAELLGDHQRAAAARAEAAAAFTAAGEYAGAADVQLTMAERLASAAHHTRALHHAMAAAAAAETAGRTDLRAQALATEGSIRTALGDHTRGVELARAGLELALSAQLTGAAGHSYYELAGALINTADYAASAGAYEAAAQLCRTHGIDELEQACVACLSVAVRFLGEWDRALVIAREVLDDTHAAPVVRMVAEEETGLIMVLRGDRRRAKSSLRRAFDFGRESGVFGIEVGATWGLALAADLEGAQTTAEQTVRTLLERCQPREDWVFALPALRWASTYLGGHAGRTGLEHCHRLLATAATHNSSPKVLSALAHAGGELALLDGDAPAACAQFEQSVELLHGITVPFEQAMSRLRWGVALARSANREPAIDAVTSAYRMARQLGAKPLARTCAFELAGMGESVDRRLGRLAARALTPAGLTRREIEVLRLLAEGRTNRQIAHELYVSPRTIDMHVRNVFSKLDCSSRLAAARRAVELGLVETTRPSARDDEAKVRQ